MQSFLQNLKNGGSVLASGGNGIGTGSGSGGAPPKTAAQLAKEAKFQRFLAKEKKRAVEREHNRQDQLAKARPTFIPKLSRESREQMANVARRGDFLTRLERDNKTRSRDYEQLKHDAQCTFQPKISKKGHKSRVRTWREMAVGDAQRHEAHLADLRAEKEEKQMEGVTFAPRLIHGGVAEGVRSTLAVLKERPDAYLERLQRKARELEERQYEALLRADQKEIAECTFAPKVNDAPSYIKRIAHGVRLAKDAKRAAEPEEAEKQGWR